VKLQFSYKHSFCIRVIKKRAGWCRQ